MGNQLFSGIAEVAIQGERVLRFVNSTQDRAVYEVIGFNDQNITIIDYRQAGLQAIQTLHQTGDLSAFAPIFNSVGRVELWETDEGGMLIELSDSDEKLTEYVLWIAIGIEDSVPVYDYLVECIAPLEDDRYAFLALFHSPVSESSEGSGEEITSSSSASLSGPWEG